jgi:NitT/TauT family transport system substrate-binding protein
MLRRRTVLALPLLAACPGGQAPSGAAQLALDWFPEAEHGGFFAAQSEVGSGPRLELLPGRPEAPVLPQVAAGRCDFGIADAATILAARAQQVPIVAVFAALQTNPRCILVHADGPQRLTELRGMTLAMNIREPFSQFLQREVGLEGVSVVPYSGNIAPFLADRRSAQQAYVFSEPLVATREGVATRCLMIAELGFNPYAGVVITHERTIAERPGLVRDLVGACSRGWGRYLQDPEPANAQIHAANPEMDRDTLSRSAAALAPLVAVPGGHPGAMSLARWQTLHEQLAALGIHAADALDPARAFTTEFLPT